MPDFKVLRGSVVIASGTASVTLTNGVDYTLESGIADDAWFFQIANNHFTGMGSTSGGTQNFDDISVRAEHTGNNTTLTRQGTAGDCRVDWQIVQYIGSAGGANEIKVREKDASSVGGGSTISTAIPGTVTNNADVVPFITGQSGNYTARNFFHAGLFTAELTGGNVVFTRGIAANTGIVSWAIVEFTGSNWTITREAFANPSGTNNTVTLGTSVTDVAETFLHVQYRIDNTGTMGLDDCSVRVSLDSTTALRVWDTTSTADADKEHVVWVIQNPDMTVTRYLGTMAGTGEEEVDDITITAVADVEQTFTTLTNDSTGSGTAFPRGYINHLLTNTTTVRLRQSDNGQTSDYALEIVELPETVGGTNYTGTAQGLRNAARVGSVAGAFTGSFVATPEGVRSASRVGGAGGTFAGDVQGSPDGVRSASRVGTVSGTFGQGTTTYTGTPQGVRSSARVGTVSGTFDATFGAAVEGIRSASRAGSTSGQFDGAFGGSPQGNRSASRVGSVGGDFTGAFTGSPQGVRSAARVGAVGGTLNQGVQNFTGTPEGVRSSARVGTVSGQIAATFSGSPQGLRSASRVGTVSGQLGALFTGLAEGVRGASRVGAVSGDFAGLFTATAEGLRSAARVGAAGGQFDGALTGSPQGLRSAARVGTVSGTYAGAQGFTGTPQGVRIAPRVGDGSGGTAQFRMGGAVVSKIYLGSTPIL